MRQNLQIRLEIWPLLDNDWIILSWPDAGPAGAEIQCIPICYYYYTLVRHWQKQQLAVEYNGDT